MNENTLLKCSLLFSILGILAILFISETSSIELSKISDLTKESIEEKVRIIGEIKTIGDSPGLIILNLEDDTGTITVMLFKNEEEIPLEKNQRVEVIGTITEYKDQLEIIADQIKVA
ncbi:hypothetical protein HOG16_03130 [Candidatus Woesearchaeota archaeon]|jgi:DNA/RNA endonuclease YhcR with UshA esterase domain|nr:hypothetical protein [Candidatus Woesearchaeota archaeon]MBT4322149.1 hypothetical protein [Candidatus Woesearchaeota archaeon]MBT4630985.1 hypothetical protein [Candidatus Woesearchaeota archaeon]